MDNFTTENQGVMHKRYMSIAPVNSGEGIYGYSSGLPQILFNLGSNGLLQTDEVRLSFNLRICANGTNTNNVNPALRPSVGLYNGAESVISELELKSTNYGRSLERIDYYNRLNCSVNSALHSKSQYDSHLNHEQASSGVGFTTAQQLDLSLDDDTNSFQVNPQVAHQGVLLRNNEQGRECSMRIVCGLLLSESQISLNDLGGLTIRIKLASNESVLNDLQQVLGGAATDVSGFHYEIHNPRLIAGVVLETPQQIQQRMSNPTPTMSYLSYEGYYNNIISNEFQVNHKINSAAVISSFTNFIATKDLNNYQRMSDAQQNPNIEELTFNKDGMRVPLQYSILTDQDTVTTDDDFQPSTFPALLYHYLSSWSSPADRKKSSINPVISSIRATNSGYGVFGAGCSYDTEHQGINMKVANVGFNIRSKLLDPTVAADNTQQTPYSAYTFYLSKNQIVVDRANAKIAVMN